MSLVRISRALARDVAPLSFQEPVTHVYNPLTYARKSHEIFLKRFGDAPKRALLLGMNPGPWGMAQTGVPFGDVTMVRDWMGIDAPVDKPENEHPKRLVEGFDCPRNEVSGSRLWGWARDRFETPEDFFADFFVWNYCPLSFMGETGRNITPDKLPASERAPLFAICDDALRKTVRALQPEWVIGVGKFAEDRARGVLTEHDPERIARILHPSPASPLANKDWAGTAEKQLRELGLPNKN